MNDDDGDNPYRCSPAALQSALVFRDQQHILLTSLSERYYSEMAYTTYAHTTSFFPTSPTSPNAFAIFTHAQSPRENYALYEDLRQVFGNRNGT
ncbi:hypothetical protein BKA83DRAFT_4487392 [Pisolithus microcarpus]|nr:hypothetical protein BKA83DRAFT_4487392 [Pisolithus microcarpus]